MAINALHNNSKFFIMFSVFRKHSHQIICTVQQSCSVHFRSFSAPDKSNELSVRGICRPGSSLGPSVWIEPCTWHSTHRVVEVFWKTNKNHNNKKNCTFVQAWIIFYMGNNTITIIIQHNSVIIGVVPGLYGDWPNFIIRKINYEMSLSSGKKDLPDWDEVFSYRFWKAPVNFMASCQNSFLNMLQMVTTFKKIFSSSKTSSCNVL